MLQGLSTEVSLILASVLQFSPLSRLPAEVFVEIMSFAIARPDNYTAALTPRVKPPRPHTLLAALSVSRTWYQAITGAPQLWATLRLDGQINPKNLRGKALGWARRSLGRDRQDERLGRQDGDGPGITRLIITAAQEIAAVELWGLLDSMSEMGAFKSLGAITLSFVDGNRTVEGASREKSMTSDMFSLLHTHFRRSLQSITLCSGGRVYPDFEPASVYFAFPSLHTFRLFGTNTSSSVAGVRATILSPHNLVKDEEGAFVGRAPTGARHLALSGVVLVADAPCRLVDFPRLESLELDAMGASAVWELLSAPDLKRFDVVVHGNTNAAEQPTPNIVEAWRCVEHLHLGGTKWFAPRLLDVALLAHLPFLHLTTVDLAFASLSSAQLALFDSSYAPALTSLNLSSTTCSTRGGTLDLPTSLGALKILNISHTLWPTDATIRSLVVTTPKLERLIAIGVVALTGRPLMELVRFRMPSPSGVEDGVGRYSRLVEELRVDRCTKVDPEAVGWLRKSIQPGGFRFTWLDSSETKGKKRARLA